MTQLILAPFDPTAPGSHAQRMRMLELAEDSEQQVQTGREAAHLMRRIYEVLESRLRTDDGTPVAEALEKISADDYDALVQGMFAQATVDTVPLASTAPSNDGHAASRAARRRRGRNTS